jgi:hypothetical protein
VKNNLCIAISLALSLSASSALAQGGPSGGGPGVTPSPWTVNGSVLSYGKGGIIVGPTNIAGGSKGVGTINVSSGFFIGGNNIFNNPLSAFATTTSAQLRGVLSDETGLGLAVFNSAPTIISPVITGSFTATGLVGLSNLAVQNPNTVLANPTSGSASPIAQAMQSCVGPANALQWLLNSGFQCGVITAAASSVAIGTTSITGGTSTRVMFDNAGVLGEYPITGTGSVALNTSPTFVTPSLGAALATTVNGLSISTTTGALAISNGKTFTANNSVTIAGTDGKTITVGNSIGFTGTDGTSFVLPAANDNLVGVSATQTLTNKTLSSAILVNANLGVSTGTSIALGGCTIGTSALCASGTVSLVSSSPNALAIGLNGATNPALQVDASTALSATGLSIKSAASGAGVGIAAISSAVNDNLTINAKGTGSISIGNLSTGNVSLGPPVTLASSITYGGVTFNNATTGSGNLVGSASPTFTGTLTASAGFFQNTVSIATTSPNALSVNAGAGVNPAFQVDTSAASQAAGLKITGAVAGGTVSLAAIDSASNTNLQINAKGSGGISIGNVSTGSIAITPALALSSSLTYGGVTLANSVTGTGSMVLSASPTITGHPTIEGVTSTGATGTGNFVFSANPSISNLTVTAAFNATGLVTFADVASAAIATSANVISGASSVLVPASAIYSAETTTTFGTTTTFDLSTFINTAVTMTGNITTMTLANVKAGQSGQIRFIQDATGSRTTVWSSIFKFPGGTTPVLSTTPSAVDALEYSCVNTSFCVASLIQNVK